MRRRGVVLFGDSVFVGIGASRRSLGCSKIVQQLFEYPVVVIARTGYTSMDGLLNLDEVASQTECASVVIMFGNNDCRVTVEHGARTSPKDFRTNLLKLVKKLRSKGMPPLVCNLQPIDSVKYLKECAQAKELADLFGVTPYEWQKKYSEECERVAKETGVPLIDIRKRLECLSDEVIADDGLHPNDKGHRIIADEIVVSLMLPHPIHKTIST